MEFRVYRAELKVTHLRWRSPICGFLRFSAKICGFLRFPAPSKCLNFQEKGWICENLRFSAKICVLGSLCYLSSVPLSCGVPWVYLRPLGLVQVCQVCQKTECPKSAKSDLVSLGRDSQKSLSLTHRASPVSHQGKQPKAGGFAPCNWLCCFGALGPEARKHLSHSP